MSDWDVSTGGFSKKENETEDITTIITRIAKKHPIELDEQFKALDKPLILECAFPGWQLKMWPPKEVYEPKMPPNYEESGVRYPAVPSTIEEQISQLTEAVKAGCAAVHVHPRDPKDGMAIHSVNLLSSIYDGVMEQVDAIPIQHTWKRTDDGRVDYLEYTRRLLEAGKGNKYCQGAVVLWPVGDTYPSGYVASVQEGVRFLEENNIKPVHKLRSSYHVRQMKRVLIDTGVMKNEPFVLVHDMGHPFGWPMDIDPWMPIDLITSIMQTRARIPNSVIGVFSGGRNWMPITMTAILAGVDLVRVGIEDVYWMYPHRNEVIQKNIDCVNKIIQFCELIGRKIASTEEARQIMGMTRTS